MWNRSTGSSGFDPIQRFVVSFHSPYVNVCKHVVNPIFYILYFISYTRERDTNTHTHTFLFKEKKIKGEEVKDKSIVNNKRVNVIWIVFFGPSLSSYHVSDCLDINHMIIQSLSRNYLINIIWYFILCYFIYPFCSLI